MLDKNKNIQESKRETQKRDNFTLTKEKLRRLGTLDSMSWIPNEGKTPIYNPPPLSRDIINYKYNIHV